MINTLNQTLGVLCALLGFSAIVTTWMSEAKPDDNRDMLKCSALFLIAAALFLH